MVLRSTILFSHDRLHVMLSTTFLTESAMTVLLLVNLYHLSMPVRKISMLGFHAKLAKLRGAKKVIMIEINDNRLETAKQFGGSC